MTRKQAEKLLDRHTKYQNKANEIENIFFNLLVDIDPSHPLVMELGILPVTEPEGYKEEVLKALYGE